MSKASLKKLAFFIKIISMEEFIIQNEVDFIRVVIEKAYDYPENTCHWGGYDTESKIEIRSGSFSVSRDIYISTGEVFEFYVQLLTANERLAGSINFENYESDLKFNIAYDNMGHVLVTGSFSGRGEREYYNSLKFGFQSDQTFIQKTLSQLKMIVEKYGDQKGVKR